jgi:hypothetical protein
MIKMKTLKHKLLSESEKEVELSEEYSETADNLIRDLRGLQSPEDIIGTLTKYGYSFDTQINTAAHAFFYAAEGSPESKKINDKLHILLGMRAIDEDTKVGYIKLREEYDEKKRKFQRDNDSMYDQLAWHLGNLK